MKVLLKFFMILTSLIFVFVACGSNVKGTNVSKNSYESNEFKKEVLKVSKVFLLDSNGIKSLNQLPKELQDIENVKSGVLVFDNSNVSILVVSLYSSMDEATNEVLNKNDVSKFVFNNFVKFKNGKESNEEYIKDIDLYRYLFKDDFEFKKSYILEVLDSGKKQFKVVSVYKSSEENLERNIISVWEGICWDKEINLNITEKFIKLIISNYDEIKKKGKWIN